MIPAENKSYYLETSVLLRILLNQKDSQDWIDKIKSSHHLITSRLTQVEASRALIRLSLDYSDFERARPDVERDLRTLYSRIDFIEIDSKICEAAGRIAPLSRLRSLDAIHLATFQTLREKQATLEMLTVDERLLSQI